MREVKQSSAVNVMVFMADSTDHVTGKTGLTLTITASKDGAAFAAITPTVTERGNGWYNLALTSSHSDTLGDLIVRATGTGADAGERALNVVANVEADTYARVGAPTGASIAADIATRSSHSAADTWAVATRVLTAGTNIILAKGTGVTGFNDLSAAQVNTECDTALTDYDPPTRAEATTDKDAIITEVNANETKIDTISGNLTRVLGLTLDNHVEDTIVRDSNGNKTSSILYAYNSAANATTHDGVTGLIGKYNVTATYSGSSMTLFKVTRVT